MEDYEVNFYSNDNKITFKSVANIVLLKLCIFGQCLLDLSFNLMARIS